MKSDKPLAFYNGSRIFVAHPRDYTKFESVNRMWCDYNRLDNGYPYGDEYLIFRDAKFTVTKFGKFKARAYSNKYTKCIREYEGEIGYAPQHNSWWVYYNKHKLEDLFSRVIKL